MKTVEEIGKRCITILDFLEKTSKEKNSIIEEFRNVIAMGVARQDRKGLVAVLKDFVEWANDLSTSDFASLNALYGQLYGETINDNNNRLIKRIIKAEKINTEDEYRVIQNYLEQNFEKEMSDKNVQKAKSIIIEYEKERSVG
ncbi:hypothetical protein SAMN05421788_101539 [Filimonas lacunae]|uniref:Uncharacterized protein n=1 Tax=Filimonas lacunae TaxID=477680 RepID=A0A1N7L025_9BACT|nr:hypothetical protein [Filimonas lacunae]SIS67183.1 hypothetical protein SAMN05421788_101539 [Filimonas lacunae]